MKALKPCSDFHLVTIEEGTTNTSSDITSTKVVHGTFRHPCQLCKGYAGQALIDGTCYDRGCRRKLLVENNHTSGHSVLAVSLWYTVCGTYIVRYAAGWHFVLLVSLSTAACDCSICAILCTTRPDDCDTYAVKSNYCGFRVNLNPPYTLRRNTAIVGLSYVQACCTVSNHLRLMNK